MNGDDWLVAQSGPVEQLIANETEQDQLAHRSIPEVTVPGETTSASLHRFDATTGIVDEKTQVDIERFREGITISKLQIDAADPTLAFVAIARACQKLAHQHDERVFRKALSDAIEAADKIKDPAFQPIVKIPSPPPRGSSVGEEALASVATAVAKLDDEGYRTGYVMVVGNNIWTELHRLGPKSSTLPITAVRALIDDGPVHRSSVLKDDDALLLAVGPGRVDSVIAEGPRLAYINQTADVRTFDLYERFVPRFRETLSAVLLQP